MIFATETNQTRIMKKILILSLALIFGLELKAQEPTRQFPLAISYFSHTLYQPGAKLGTSWTFRSWPAEGSADQKQKSLYLSPQLGYYALPNDHSNWLINVELGYRRLKLDKRRFVAFSFGLGYFHRSRVRTLSVDLGDGSIGNKQREKSHYLLPSLNFEFGRQVNDRIEWFSKWTYGLATAFDQEPTSMIFVELGARFYLLGNYN